MSEAGDRLRQHFADRGWSIHMQQTTTLDPFAELAEAYVSVDALIALTMERYKGTVVQVAVLHLLDDLDVDVGDASMRYLATRWLETKKDQERGASPLTPLHRMLEEAGYTNLHRPEKCAGQVCMVHNPSEHHMRTWPLDLRLDKGGPAERMCRHGIGHPDPDSLAWVASLPGRDRFSAGMHGCDGCCRPVGKA